MRAASRLLALPLLLLLLQGLTGLLGQPVEEFFVHGPMDLHQTAMNAFMEARRKNPNISLSGDDSEFMKKANEYAVKRMRRKPDEELVLRVSVEESEMGNCARRGSILGKSWPAWLRVT